MLPGLRWHVLIDLPDGRHALFFGKKAVFLSAKQKEFFDNWRHSFLYLKEGDHPSFSAEDEIFRTQFIEWAKSNSWLLPETVPDTVSSSTAINVVEQALAMWGPLVAFSDLPKVALRNKVNAWLFLIEKCWFVSKAQFYLGPGSEELDELRVLFEQEQDHHLPMVSTLGISVADLSQHDCFLSTRLVVSHLFELSASRPMSLLVSLALFEADPKRQKAVFDFYRDLSAVAELDLSAFYSHFELDLKFGHACAWKNELEKLGTVPTELLNSILDDLHATKHLIQYWHKDQISEIENLAEIVRLSVRCPRDLIKPQVTVGSFLSISRENG